MCGVGSLYDGKCVVLAVCMMVSVVLALYDGKCVMLAVCMMVSVWCWLFV